MPSAVERSGAARASGTGAKPGVEQAPSPVPSAIAPRPAPPSPRRNPRRFTGGGSLVIAAPHQAEHGPAVPQPVAGGGLAACPAAAQRPGACRPVPPNRSRAGTGATVRGRPRLPPSTSVAKSHVLITLQRSGLPSPRAVPGEDRAGIRTTDPVSDPRRADIGYARATGHFRRWWRVLGSNQGRPSRRFTENVRPCVLAGLAGVAGLPVIARGSVIEGERDPVPAQALRPLRHQPATPGPGSRVLVLQVH